MERAIECLDQVLAITEAQGESVYRSIALWAMAFALWQQGDRTRATQLLNQALRLSRQVNNPRAVTTCLEVLAWIAGEERNGRRAAILMGASRELGKSVGTSPVILRHMLANHDECEQTARRVLGERAFKDSSQEGRDLGWDAAIAYGLDEQPPQIPTPVDGTVAKLTKRERQVADLVAKGLTNRQIAARLVISPRTAQGHVEHVLTKLGFTSRAQIAAWVVELGEQHT
jgi:non-specific serine/threonine protein kinase